MRPLCNARKLHSMKPSAQPSCEARDVLLCAPVTGTILHLHVPCPGALQHQIMSMSRACLLHVCEA